MDFKVLEFACDGEALWLLHPPWVSWGLDNGFNLLLRQLPHFFKTLRKDPKRRKKSESNFFLSWPQKVLLGNTPEHLRPP